MTVIGLALIVALGLLAYGQLTNSASRPTGTTDLALSGDTARRAYAPAVELALEWQQDARLASISGQALSIGKKSGNEVKWGFQFFSPSTQELALVAVSGGEARMVRPPMLSPYKLSTFSPDEWRIDSDQALQTWWERGGYSMVKQYTQVDAAMQLRISEELGSQPVWVIAGIAANKNTTLTIFVNASDGSLVANPR
ncbi:MAG: hypothetical protein JW918_07840 [Anaerolineae bacterium]|nr:hypothetical protein [Anaerolineae bacterium]